MRRIATIALVFLFGGAIYAQTAPKMTIADLFALLPEKHRTFLDAPVSLKYVVGKWSCPECGDRYGFSEPVVDTKNGYIRLSQSGGGSTEREIALFTTQDKRNILGIRYYENNGANCAEASIVFLERAADVWGGSTGRVLPKLEYGQFLKKQYASKKFIDREMKMITKYFQLDYALPRYGTVVKVTAFTAPRCTDSYPGEEVINFLRENDLFGTTRNLAWDAGAGVFKEIP
ncbi:MAG: hypothetical protein JXA20_19465 [Spirochaetes bacterium]|nr:hypothetical protein [Spirochaetota bacterium]